MRNAKERTCFHVKKCEIISISVKFKDKQKIATSPREWKIT